MRMAFGPVRELPAAIVMCAGAVLWCLLAAPPPPLVAAEQGTGLDDVKKRLDALPPGEQVPLLESLRAQYPESARLSFYLGNAYLNLARPDSAVFYYSQALAADSTYARAHVNMAIALEKMNRFDDAKTHYEKAIDIDSTDVLALCHLGHYYHVRGELGEAVKRYRSALDIDPRSAQAHYNLGLAFADARLFAEALREWREVAALSPESEIGRTAAENVRLIETYVEMNRGAARGP